MARVSGRLVVTGCKEREHSMVVVFSDVLISPHQLRRGGYYRGQKTFEAMIQVLSQEFKSEDITPNTDHKLIRIGSPKSSKQVELAALPFEDNMSGNVVLVDSSGPGPLLKLLVNIHQFVVKIDEVTFECSAYPFVLKSSFFKDSIQNFKNSTTKVEPCPIPEIPLELPGGRHTFELIRIFCYDSRVTITKENILNLLAASTSLGFTEDVAPENLLSQCQRFIEEANIMSIMSILKHSRDTNLLITEVDNSHLLITKLAQHALAFQNSHEPAPTREIVELISELRFLHPRIVDATLREFRRLGVHLVAFFWCTELPTNLDVLLCCDVRNGRSIFTYFSEALDECIAAGEVHLEKIDPQKLVMVLNPGVLTQPMKSGDIIQEYLASKLSELNINDVVLHLDPRVLTDLVSRAVMVIPHEMHHLAEMVDRALVLEAERSPWDGSRDAMDRFMEMAECVERESHDMLYDAVERFAQLSCTHEEAEDIWNMIDVEKLSETKFDAAVQFCLQNRDHYYVRLLRRRQANHLSLKRKLYISVPLEEGGPRRRSRRKSLFPVFVRALDGSHYSLEVEPGATIGDIRDAIGERHRLERFWWPVYRGQKLLMSHTVASYGIEKDCTLSMKVLLVDEPEREVCPTSSDARDFFETHTPCVCGCK